MYTPEVSNQIMNKFTLPSLESLISIPSLIMSTKICKILLDRLKLLFRRHEGTFFTAFKRGGFYALQKCIISKETHKLLKPALQQHVHTVKVLVRRKRHMNHVFRAWLEYYKERDSTILHTTKYCWIIVDGVDQWALVLHRFVSKTTKKRGHSLKVCLMGLHEHNQNNHLHLYTITEQYEKGSSRV